MRVILGTIALEPNRWTGKRNPRFSLLELLPLVKEAGFDKLEVWQWHVSGGYVRDMREARTRADDLGVTFPYIGVYPSFVLEGPEGREEERLRADILDKAEILGTSALKIMLGSGLKGSAATADQVALTAERFGNWYRAARARDISLAAELHSNTLFDPVECGIAFMNQFPELDFSICYQPYDFADTANALALADRFAGRISHMHLLAPRPKEEGGRYALLEEARLDYRTLIPHILRRNPTATMTLEFVKECVQDNPSFDLQPVLANARLDALFVERVLKEAGL
ncbi:MAG: TIM barrel protein [Kiritimatiellia bacterium]